MRTVTAAQLRTARYSYESAKRLYEKALTTDDVEAPILLLRMMAAHAAYMARLDEWIATNVAGLESEKQ